MYKAWKELFSCSNYHLWRSDKCCLLQIMLISKCLPNKHILNTKKCPFLPLNKHSASIKVLILYKGPHIRGKSGTFSQNPFEATTKSRAEFELLRKPWSCPNVTIVTPFPPRSSVLDDSIGSRTEGFFWMCGACGKRHRYCRAATVAVFRSDGEWTLALTQNKTNKKNKHADV